MPTPISRLQFQDYQFQVVKPAGVWKWTTRVDVSQSLPVFEVRDIISPYGLLRDSIPLPGDVVQAMSGSITQIQQSFAPLILISPTVLTFTVDEGRGVSPPLPLMVTNNGIFGSLLGVSVSSSAPYVEPTPANVNGLASNEAGQVQVAVDSSSLLAVGSPYAATLTVQDPNAGNTPQTATVHIVVRSKATITVPSNPLQFTATSPGTGGPFPPVPSQQFSLQNTGAGDSVLNYQLQKLINNSPWLVSFTPVFGTINGGGSQPITVVVAPDATMLPGLYTETLRVSGYSSNFYQDVQVALTIQ